MPMTQRGDPLLFTYFYIGVRAERGSPALLARSVAAALTAVNRDLTMTLRPLSDFVDDSLAQDRLVAMLSGFFGGLALLLAGLGLYGVTAYAVARRRTEIGIRMALGAPPADVVRLVLSRIAGLVGAGVIVGAGVSLWASTLIASLLYGLAPRDPVTFALAAITLTTVAALAGWLPAHSASRIDPAEVLRES
jgi:ABC-type antimicrobial peptide transport system permease subunit